MIMIYFCYLQLNILCHSETCHITKIANAMLTDLYVCVCVWRCYLVHAGTHVLISLAHGDLFTQRTSWQDNENTMSQTETSQSYRENWNCWMIVGLSKPFFFFLLFLLLRTFSCSSRILSSAIWELSARLNVDMSHAYRNSDRYLYIHGEKASSTFLWLSELNRLFANVP